MRREDRSMTKLVCENCGSNELYEENGYRICRYCGTRHQIPREERTAQQSTISWKADVEAMLQKCREEPERAGKYAERILEMDPGNTEARKYLVARSSGGSSNGCYVATAVYGSYDCPQVWTLRRYRDDVLAETWCGRLFIAIYYAISPALVKWFGKTEWFTNLWRPKLDRMVERLIKQGIADTPYQDRQW